MKALHPELVEDQTRGSFFLFSMHVLRCFPRYGRLTCMSFVQMKELLTSLTPDERAELRDCLQAMDEGISVQELHLLHAALDEEINHPSPGLTLDEVRKSVSTFGQGNVASA